MDTRRLITAVMITMLVVIAYQAIINLLGVKLGYIQPPTTQPAEQLEPATAQTSPAAPSAGSAPASTPPTMAAPALRTSLPAEVPANVVLGSVRRNDPDYRLAVEIVPQGAAVRQVVLNEFTKEVNSDDPYVFQQPLKVPGDWTRAMTTRSITLDGTTVALDGVPWTLESSDSKSAVFHVTIENDAGPVARLRKSYEVFPKSEKNDAGYEIVVRHALENLTNRALVARLTTNGPITPPREVDRGPDRYIVSGYFAEPRPNDRRVEILHHAIEELSPEKPQIDLTRNEQSTASWAGALSVYFVGIARPVGESAAMIDKAEAVALNPQAPAHEREASIVFETGEMQLQAGQSTSLPMRVFFGPRQRKLLKNDYFTRLGYNQILVLTGGPCAYCTFQWLIDLLVLLLRGFHWIFGGFAGHGDWGLAIIGLVVLVRALLHPVTKKSQISMMKMSKLGPEIERLRKKYGDDKDALNKEMMKFYKEQGATPILGCLPMLLQMPIWIALWSALNSTFELRHGSFLWGYTWIEDLAKPDHLIAFSQPVDIWFLHISGINLLPILMGVVFYLQMKIQPKPVSMTKEQEQQQKIIMWMMPLLFPLMLYSGPSGLNLYILTSTFIGIIESKVIRDHIKQREQAAAAQRVIVDAKPTRGSKKARIAEPASEPKKGIAGWLANLQDRAEQLRREAERKGK